MGKLATILSTVVIIGTAGCVWGDKGVDGEGEGEVKTRSVSSAITGTCTTNLTTAKQRQRQAENLYHYISSNPDKQPTDATLKTHADALKAELPYLTGTVNQCLSVFTPNCGIKNPSDGQYYMIVPENSGNATICSVPAVMFRIRCVHSNTGATVNCNKIYNRAGTKTLIKMHDDLAARAEALYPNIRPFMHDEPVAGYVEFDPPTARLTANLSTTRGATASAVYVSDNTATSVRQWPTSLTLCSGTGCPAIGEPCWAGALFTNQETNKQIAVNPSNTSYRKCF